MPGQIDQTALNTALLKLARRAESVDPQKLVQTFVDIGPLMAILSSYDHQIIYGRRGTGKTHALLYSAEEARKRGDHAIYVDLRYIGSSGGIYGDPKISLPQRATKLLSDVLSSVHDQLLTMGIEANLDLASVGPALDRLAAAITDVEVAGEVTRETHTLISEKNENKGNFGLHLAANPAFEVGSSNVSEQSAQVEGKFQESGTLRHRVHFGSVSKTLKDLVAIIHPSRLILILDEWSTLPIDLQPFLADLLRRAIFPVGGVTIKIAAIEQRSQFIGEFR
jgi:Cdc6-like AAA superfamily ATPase